MSLIARPWRGWTRRHAVLALSALLTAGLSPAPLDAAPWRKLQTPNYTIFTHTSERTTRQVASDFDDFLGFLDQVIIVDKAHLKPFTVVLFDDDREFDPFKPLTKEGVNVDYVQQELVETYTSSFSGVRDDWAMTSMAAQDFEEQTARALFAGGVYWYLDGFRVHVPPAVRNGAASMLSRYHRLITHAWEGIPPPGYARILSQWDLIPVKKLMTMNGNEAAMDHSRVRFSAESWALAHYLMFSRWSEERHAFPVFWEAFRDGATVNEALARALGPQGAADIDIDLRTYVRSSLIIAKVPRGPRVDNRCPIVPADPMEVEVALAKAAMIARLPSAVTHADAAVQASGGRVEAYDIRAEALAANKADEAALEGAVSDALARGSRSSWVYWRSARFRFDALPAHVSESKEARAVVDASEQAANLDRRFRPAFDLEAQALPLADHVSADDGKFLDFARANFPADRWILAGQSVLSARRGDREDAAQLRARALSGDSRLDPNQIPAIKRYFEQIDKTAATAI